MEFKVRNFSKNLNFENHWTFCGWPYWYPSPAKPPLYTPGGCTTMNNVKKGGVEATGTVCRKKEG